MSAWLDRFIWWHRIRGHNLDVRYGMLMPSKLTRCHHEDCGWYWTQYLV